MARESIISSDSSEDSDDQYNGDPNSQENRDLRPTRMKDMVGQREVIEQLEIVLEAAKKRGETLGHVLFDGPPGLGKTTFATVIPAELGVPVEFAVGPALKAPKDVVPYLTNAAEGSVLFIDEIHRLPSTVEEYLYTAMEDFRIDMVLGEGVNARTYSYKLNRFTLIGATTRAGMLSAPLRDRFPIRHHLDFYTVEELTEIVRRNAKKLDVDLHEDAAVEIARRSRSTPRIVNSRLRWIRDFADSKSAPAVTLEIARSALEMAQIDTLGLDKQDRKYLDTLIRVFGGGPAGIEAIAHTMNGAIDTLSDEIEPFLLRSEIIVRTPRGRVATSKALDHMQQFGVSDSAERRLF